MLISVDVLSTAYTKLICIINSKPHPETIEEELKETSGLCEKEKVGSMAPEASSLKNQLDVTQSEENSIDQPPSCSAKETSAPKGKDVEEIRKLRRLEQAGIKVMSAAQRYGRLAQQCGKSCTLHYCRIA